MLRHLSLDTNLFLLNISTGNVSKKCLSLLFLFSLFYRFVLITVVLVSYDKSYKCNDEKLLKVYLFVLTGLHLCMLMTEIVIVLISSKGTIANPEPRRKLPIALYVQFIIFVIEFAWDIVGVVWAFDPSIDCHQSHQVLLFTRAVLVWNFFISVTVGFYLFLRIGIYGHSHFLFV